MLAIYKHELRSMYNALTAYMFTAALLLVIGLGILLYNLQAGVANFEYVLDFVSIGLVVIIPVLTMGSISQELKQKTHQLLYSLPVSAFDIVLGKYLVVLTVYLVPLIITALYPWIFSKYGDVYLPSAYGSLAAFFLMGAAMVAVGMFISSLTENQGFAGGVSIALFAFNYFSVTLAEQVSSTAIGSVVALVVVALLIGVIVRCLTRSGSIAVITAGILIAAILGAFLLDSESMEGLLPKIMESLSLFQRFSSFVNGVFDLTGVIFYISVIVLGLFLTVQSLEKRRYN